MASRFVGLFPDRVVWVRALARDIVLCSYTSLYSHSVSLHPGVYMGTGKFNVEDNNPAMDQPPIQGGLEILLVAL